jgi:L-ascorbate metabolism protein UlaG (beta-lactamase superfamily)
MTNLSKFLHSKEDGVFYIGHASIIARLSQKNYLFDYIKNSKPYGDAWKFFPPLISNIDVKSIDGIFISHLHQDHLDLDFLSQVKEFCPIYIIDGRPEFNKILDEVFIEYKALEPNKKIILEDDVCVYGVLHETNGIDSSIVLANDSFSVYHGNDNYCSIKTLESIKRDFGSIDVACIPYAYINWYPQLLDGITEDFRETESIRLINYYFELALLQAKELNAQQIIPFGANLIYYDSAYSAANLECRTPPEFESYVLKNYGKDLAKRFKALYAGDIIVKDKLDNLMIKQYKQYTPENYRDEIEYFLKKFDYVKPPDLKEEILIDEVKLNRLNSKALRDIKNRVNHKILLSSQSFKPRAICIDLKKIEVTITNLDDNILENNNNDMHIITTSDSLFNKWINSEIRLEEIIGTRNFLIKRVPNIYRPDILRIISTEL